jgi:hypothetical protein
MPEVQIFLKKSWAELERKRIDAEKVEAEIRDRAESDRIRAIRKKAIETFWAEFPNRVKRFFCVSFGIFFLFILFAGPPGVSHWTKEGLVQAGLVSGCIGFIGACLMKRKH